MGIKEATINGGKKTTRKEERRSEIRKQGKNKKKGMNYTTRSLIMEFSL